MLVVVERTNRGFDANCVQGRMGGREEEEGGRKVLERELALLICG